ncbi:MAG: dihydrofolate reductase [Lachnospiraceae bacterium]|nr:dihydrofolate reductase [Lachnospiraceae bacterium]
MLLIVAVDKNWAIGKNNDLLIPNLKPDKQFFRAQTLNKTMIIGRKTLESFPKPLKDRRVITITRNQAYEPLFGEKASSIEEALEMVKETSDDEIFVAGGGEIYKALLPYCNKALVTKIDESYEADTYFPNLDESEEWVMTEEGEMQNYEGVNYKFTTYSRK